MAKHLDWPDYSAAQFEAVRIFIASATVVAEHGKDRCMRGAEYDTLGIQRSNALYYASAASYLRWCGASLDRHLKSLAKGAKRHGTVN